jgi:hypothetical protein
MGVKSVLVPFMPQADLCAYGMFTQDLADAAVFRGNCRAAVHGVIDAAAEALLGPQYVRRA